MSGRGGLSNKWFGDINKHGYTDYTETGNPNLRYLAKDNEIVNGLHNPVIKYGYSSPVSDTFLSPTISGTAVAKTASVNLVDPINHFIFFCHNNSHIYLAEEYYKSTVTDIITVSSALQALVTFTDACLYQLNGGSKLYFAWNGVSNGYISTYDIGDPTGASWNENWSQADVTNPMVFGVRTKLIPSGDGFMYILDGNKVHRLDGSTIGGTQGTLYQSVLQGEGGSIITMGAEYRNKLYLVVNRTNTLDNYNSGYYYRNSSSPTGLLGIYVWNKQSTFYNSSDFIQIPGGFDVRAIWVSPVGDLRIMVVDSQGEASIRIFDGTTFKIDKKIPHGALPQTTKSIMVHGSFTYWLGNDGYIYGYGSDIPGEKEFLFIIGDLDIGGTNNMVGGSLVCVSTPGGDASPSGYKPTDVFWLTYSTDGTDGYIKTFYPYANNTIATSNNIEKNEGNIFYPVKILPSLSTVKHINIIMERVEGLSSPTTSEATIKFYFNQSTTPSFSKTITRADISKGYISIEINKPFVNSIQLEVEHIPGTNIGVADFAPAYAELVYDTTSTLK